MRSTNGLLAWLVAIAICSRQASAVTCDTVNVNGMSYDLNKLPVGYFTADMMYNGGASSYVWGMSLCHAQPGSAVYPPGQPCADDPTFLQQFRPAGGAPCDSAYNSLNSISVTNESQVSLQYTVLNCPTCRFSGYTATVNIQCGDSDSLTPIGDVQALGTYPNINFVFTLQFNGICGTMPVPTTRTSVAPTAPPSPPHTSPCSTIVVNGRSVDLRLISDNFFTVPLSYNGNNGSDFLWGVSPCRTEPVPIVNPPRTPCVNAPAYMYQYVSDNGGECLTAFNNYENMRIVDGVISWQYSVVDCPSCRFNGYTATVTLQCGPSGQFNQPLLEGDVLASGSYPNISYEFRLTWENVCPNSTAPPSPTNLTTTLIPPPMPPAPTSQCGTVEINGISFDLNTLPVGYFTTDQIYQGGLASYVWAFSLCAPQHAADIYPLGQPCGDGPTYVQQFTANGQCESGFNNAVSTSVADGVLSMHFSVENCATCRFSNFFAVVNIRCQPGTGAMFQPLGDVQAQGTFPYVYLIFDLGYEGVCGPDTPAPMPISCGTVQVNGITFDLNTLPAGFFTADQTYKNGVSPYVWALSLCTLEPSSGIYPSGLPCGGTSSSSDMPTSYIQQFDGENNCFAGYNALLATDVSNDGTVVTLQYGVSNCTSCRFDAYAMTVAIRCGSNHSLTPSGPVRATGQYPQLSYHMDLEYAGVCGGTTGRPQ